MVTRPISPSGGDGGIPDAPSNGRPFERKDNAWVVAEDIVVTSESSSFGDADSGSVISFDGSTSKTVTLPLISALTNPTDYAVGARNITTVKAVVVTISPSGSNTINGSAGGISLFRGQQIDISNDGVSDWRIIVTSVPDLEDISSEAIDTSWEIPIQKPNGDMVKIALSKIPIVTLGSFDTNDATFPSTDPAVASSRNSHPLLGFDDTTAESVIFQGVLPEDYQGGDVNINVCWVAETATSGGVVWGVEIERLAAGGTDIDSDSFAAQQTTTTTAPGTSGVINRASLTLTKSEADSWEAGDAYRLKLSRVVGDGGDTMTGDAQALRVMLDQ